MKLRLNLATRPQANNRPFLAGAALGGALAFVALLLLCHIAYTSWVARRELRSEMESWESQIRVDQARHEELESYFREPNAQNVIDRSTFLNSLIAERSFPWTKILTDLGQTLPPRVRVISISPHLDNGRAQVTLQVGAASDEGKLQFLQAVENSSAFSGLVVKSEHHPDQLSSPDRVVLDLTVWYTTSAPSARATVASSEANVNHEGFGVIRNVNLEESDGQAEVNITGSNPLTYHTMQLRNPDRLVLDFADAHLTVAEKHIASNLDPVREIRMAQFTPQISRVVIDLRGPATYRVKTDGNNVVVAFAVGVNGRD